MTYVLIMMRYGGSHEFSHESLQDAIEDAIGQLDEDLAFPHAIQDAATKQVVMTWQDIFRAADRPLPVGVQ
jgi:hypothetical protein